MKKANAFQKTLGIPVVFSRFSTARVASSPCRKNKHKAMYIPQVFIYLDIPGGMSITIYTGAKGNFHMSIGKQGIGIPVTFLPATLSRTGIFAIGRKED